MSVTFEKYFSAGGYSWGPDYTLIHSSTMEKVAGECHTPAELLKVIDTLKARPEGVYVLLNALGAYEYWGVNRNGDAFPEWSLKSQCPPADVKNYIDKVNREKPGFNFCPPPTNKYGTCTFVTDAHVFQQHNNKDPHNSIGDVVASAYNEYMHRTELIVFIYEARDKGTVDAIRAGAPVPFSMGAKLPFDVCSICFNFAKNRGEYCDHLKSSMNMVYPDGRKVFAYNWFPRFFDISRVRVPADRSAWALRKVASAENDIVVRPPSRIVMPGIEFTKVAAYGEKLGAATKLSAMIKEVPPETQAKSMGSAPVDPTLLSFVRSQVSKDMDQCDNSITDPQMEAAAKREGMRKTLGGLSLAGMLLRPPELGQLSKITGEGVPDSLDLGKPSSKLITVIRIRKPESSLVDPEFSERRKVALASGEVSGSLEGYDNPEYQKYLALVHKEMGNIVKAASAPEIKILMNPNWMGASLFKTASAPDPIMSWLPFMTAVKMHMVPGA